MRMRLTLLVALLAAAVGACQYPRDPEGTLDRIEDKGVIRVGVVENEPWVKLPAGKEPAGVEPELVRQFAEELDAGVEWVEGSELTSAALIGSSRTSWSHRCARSRASRPASA